MNLTALHHFGFLAFVTPVFMSILPLESRLKSDVDSVRASMARVSFPDDSGDVYEQNEFKNIESRTLDMRNQYSQVVNRSLLSRISRISLQESHILELAGFDEILS